MVEMTRLPFLRETISKGICLHCRQRHAYQYTCFSRFCISINVLHVSKKIFLTSKVDYFYNMYKAPIGKKAEMGPVGFKRLNSKLSLWLEREVTFDEIKLCVWDCDGSKSPGPDGFNFKFYKLAWDFIAEDLFDLITEFFRTGSMPKGVNLSYITLVTKKKVTLEFKEYRPISLIHGIYKIIAKILSNRLKEVIGSLISDNQIAL